MLLLCWGPTSFPVVGGITSLLFQLGISLSSLPTYTKSNNGLNLVEMNFSLILRQGPKSAVMGWCGHQHQDPNSWHLALLFRLEAASGPRRPAGVPGIRSTFQRRSKKNKGEARGTQGRCLPAFEFFRSPASPQALLTSHWPEISPVSIPRSSAAGNWNL